MSVESRTRKFGCHTDGIRVRLITNNTKQSVLKNTIENMPLDLEYKKGKKGIYTYTRIKTKRTLLIGFPYSVVLLSKKIRLILEKDERFTMVASFATSFFCKKNK